MPNIGRPRLQLDEAKLRSMWGKEKIEAIAIALGCSSGTVLFRAACIGLPKLAPSRGRRLTAEQRQALESDLRAGMSNHEAAEKHSLHISTVRQAVRRVRGVSRIHRRWCVTKLRIACEQGLTLAEISKALGAPEATVRHRLNRLGLRYRRVSRRKPCDIRAMAADFKAGMSWSRMAAKHGFRSKWGVIYRMEREGLQVRRRKA